MVEEDVNQFINMVEIKQGWIQDAIENLFDLVIKNDEIERLEDPRDIYWFTV